MKKYKGITLPIHGPWDLEKFGARPSRRGGGEARKIRVWEGRVSEGKDMKHVVYVGNM